MATPKCDLCGTPLRVEKRRKGITPLGCPNPECRGIVYRAEPVKKDRR